MTDAAQALLDLLAYSGTYGPGAKEKHEELAEAVVDAIMDAVVKEVVEMRRDKP